MIIQCAQSFYFIFLYWASLHGKTSTDFVTVCSQPIRSSPEPVVSMWHGRPNNCMLIATYGCIYVVWLLGWSTCITMPHNTIYVTCLYIRLGGELSVSHPRVKGASVDRLVQLERILALTFAIAVQRLCTSALVTSPGIDALVVPSFSASSVLC